MRLRLMATYLGVPYQAGLGPDGTEVTLFSPGPPPEELGFTAAAGHWRKQVKVADLGALWQSRPVGGYRGEPCLVLDDLGDRLHIAYLGRDAARAAQLGYWEIDREVFEVVVARHEVTGLTEERVDFPLAAATFPPPGRPAEASAGTAPAGVTRPARFARPAGYSGTTTNAAPQGNTSYRGVEVNGQQDGNGQLTGYGGANHAFRLPDRMAAWHGSPEPWPGPEAQGAGTSHAPEPAPALEPAPAPKPVPAAGPVPAPEHGPGSGPGRGSEQETSRVLGRRTGRKDRIAPESVFAELLSLAAIPQAAYAVDEEVPGAMCLVQTEGGFEVFSRTDDARLEVHFFEEEEAAYFYLFGVLAAEAVRSGRLVPGGPHDRARANGQRDGSRPAEPAARSRPPGTSPAAAANVSKYLRGRKLPKYASSPARVKLAGGADGPPLPKQPRRPPRSLS